MAEKEIALLREQLASLDEPKFDLDAWKNHTLIFLERIFGKDSSKLKLIRELRYDYSSWSLRDTAAIGKAKDKDPVKMQAREILEATITELEKLGLPGESSEPQKVRELLEDELTGKQVKEIDNILKSEEKLDKSNLAAIIAKLLMN
jgi:hypothetical protein